MWESLSLSLSHFDFTFRRLDWMWIIPNTKTLRKWFLPFFNLSLYIPYSTTWARIVKINAEICLYWIERDNTRETFIQDYSQHTILCTCLIEKSKHFWKRLYLYSTRLCVLRAIYETRKRRNKLLYHHHILSFRNWDDTRSIECQEKGFQQQRL